MSVPYYGDFAEDDTVDIPFNTFTSDDPSASSTITNLINTDIHIHKDGAVAQRNNAAGITVSVDFDGITGNHLVKIDTSDDTVAGFWVTGSEYQVRMEGTTVDGATINAWIGAFSIERAGGVIALLKLILVDTGTTLDTLIKDIPTVAEFEARSDLAGTAATPAEAEAACDASLVTYDPPTRTELTTDKNSIITEVDANETKIDALNDLSAADVMDTVDALLGGLNDISPAEVNAEVVDALNVDTYAEPGQEAPGATVSLVKKISYCYKFLRNIVKNDGTTIEVYNDAGDTVDQKSTVGEAAGTVTRGKFGTGP